MNFEFLGINFISAFENHLSKILAKEVPELAQMEKRNIRPYQSIMEEEFVDKILRWKTPGADTTYFSLKLKRDLNIPISCSEKKNITDKIIKIFHRTDEATLRNASIHFYHSVIGILNILYSSNHDSNVTVNLSEPLGRETIANVIGETKVGLILKVLKKTEHKDGGFCESLNSDEPTITDTASALWIYWHMGLLQDCNYKKILKFVEACESPNGNMLGYKNSLKERFPWLCSTYYVLRILRTLNRLEKGSEDEANDKYEKIVNFILDSKIGGKGFAGNKILKDPNTVHTKNAMSMLANPTYNLTPILKKNLSEVQLKAMVNDVRGFLSSCQYKGVYGFGETRYFQPNVYATSLAVDSLKYLYMLINDDPSNYDFSMIVDDKQKKQIEAFLNACFDDEKDMYRGYSLSTEFLPKDHLREPSKLLNETFEMPESNDKHAVNG